MLVTHHRIDRATTYGLRLTVPWMVVNHHDTSASNLNQRKPLLSYNWWNVGGLHPPLSVQLDGPPNFDGPIMAMTHKFNLYSCYLPKKSKPFSSHPSSSSVPSPQWYLSPTIIVHKSQSGRPDFILQPVHISNRLYCIGHFMGYFT